MEDFIKAVNDYNNAISAEDAEVALKECVRVFSNLVREFAPSQSYGREE